MSACKAKQYSDQMMCGKCGLQWDMNDPDPPVCPKKKPVNTESPEREDRDNV